MMGVQDLSIRSSVIKGTRWLFSEQCSKLCKLHFALHKQHTEEKQRDTERKTDTDHNFVNDLRRVLLKRKSNACCTRVWCMGGKRVVFLLFCSRNWIACGCETGASELCCEGCGRGCSESCPTASGLSLHAE